MFSQQQLEALKAPLVRSHVKTRQQAGRAMSYVEGWHAIAEANRIFGFDCWARETVELRQLGEPILGKDRNGNDQWRVAYLAKVRITVCADVHIIIREGCGYGSGIDKDLGSAHESALKEAETDAMKRALMTFGNPFGLALYDKEQTDVVDAPKPAPAAPAPTPAPKATNGAAPPPPATAPKAKTMTPEEWAASARATIRDFDSSAGLNAWVNKNDSAIHKLERTNPKEFNAVQEEMQRAYSRLSTLMAG